MVCQEQVDYGYGDAEPDPVDYGYGDVDYGYGDAAPDQDYGYGDAQPDYGYGDAKPSEDYGYGDAQPDYGYGDAKPDEDYGYGDQVEEKPKEEPKKPAGRRPKRRCSVTKYTLDETAQAAQTHVDIIQQMREGSKPQDLNPDQLGMDRLVI